MKGQQESNQDRHQLLDQLNVISRADPTMKYLKLLREFHCCLTKFQVIDRLKAQEYHYIRPNLHQQLLNLLYLGL